MVSAPAPADITSRPLVPNNASAALVPTIVARIPKHVGPAALAGTAARVNVIAHMLASPIGRECFTQLEEPFDVSNMDLASLSIAPA
jgi:hypothetical protein